MRISYTFILLAVGIVSTILSNPVLAQTEGNSQNQTGQTSGGQQQGAQQQGGGEGADSGGQVKTGDDIGSIEELQSLTREGPPTSTKNDTTGLFQDLGEETSTDKGFAGDKEQQGGQQQGNQTAGTAGGQQQQGNQTAGTAGGQQQGNQTGNPLSDALEGLGNLFQ